MKWNTHSVSFLFLNCAETDFSIRFWFFWWVFREMRLPLNLKGQSHFLVPDKLGSASHLYFLYFPPLSQPNNTWVFLPGCPLYLSYLRIMTTNPRL